MGAISALSTAVGTLTRNRVLLGAVFVFTLLNFGLSIVTTVFSPRMAGLASIPISGLTFVLTPFFVGGLLALAYEGLDGGARFETFLDAGKANYLRLLGSMVLFAVVFGVAAVGVVFAVAIVVVFVVGASLSDAGSLAMSGGGFAAIAVVGLVGFLALMLPMFFLQFYAPAIVVSELGVVEAFKRSAGLVRRNLVSTLGYTAITALVGTVAGLAAVVVTMIGGVYGSGMVTGTSSPEIGIGLLAVGAVAVVAVTTVISAFSMAYQVAFYDDRLDSLA